MSRLSIATFVVAGTALALAACAPRSTTVERRRPQAVMVMVPAGEYVIGSGTGEENEAPVHRVRVDAFYIDKYEVTNGQYLEFIRDTDYPPPPRWRPNGGIWPEDEDLPVTWVSWYDAQAYARWRGARLPTEIEWEIAARCSSAYEYPWGDSLLVDGRLPANVAGETDSFDLGPARVDVFPDGASCWGVLNMAGNVCEWVDDWYLPAAYRERPPIGPAVVAGDSLFNQRVIRGGSWFDPPGYSRSTARTGFEPSFRSDIIGFRCARDAR